MNINERIIMTKPKRRGGKRKNKNSKGANNNGTRNKIVMPVQFMQNKKKRKSRNRKRRTGNRGGIVGANPQRFKQGMRAKGCYVTEREEILDVTGNGTNFAVVNTLALNPGQSGTFPTLQKQAVIWQRYRFKYLRFEYEPTVNEFATAGTTGKVILQANIDAADGPPTTKAAAYATDSQLVNSDLPCRKISLNIPPKYLQPIGKDWRYVRQGGLPGAADIHEYDVGNLYVSTTGTVDNTTKLGELHVYYGVQFENLLNSALEGTPANNQVSLFHQASTLGGATTVDYTFPFATTDFNGINIVNTSGSLVPPVGNYLVDLNVNNQSSAQNLAAAITTLKKNGAAITGAVGGLQNDGSGSYSLSWFIQANGTDAFTFVNNNTYPSGTNTMTANVRFVAI